MLNSPAILPSRPRSPDPTPGLPGVHDRMPVRHLVQPQTRTRFSKVAIASSGSNAPTQGAGHRCLPEPLRPETTTDNRARTATVKKDAATG